MLWLYVLVEAIVKKDAITKHVLESTARLLILLMIQVELPKVRNARARNTLLNSAQMKVMHAAEMVRRGRSWRLLSDLLKMVRW